MKTVLRNTLMLVLGVVLGCTLAFAVPALADDDHESNILLESLSDVIPHLQSHHERLLAMEAEHAAMFERLEALEFAGGGDVIIELCNGCVINEPE